jgi:hypothetical protein
VIKKGLNVMKLFKSILIILSLSQFFSVAYGAGNKVISTSDIQWGLLNPLRGEKSPRAADLWGDRTKGVGTGMLVKFNNGFSSPPHIHNITYRGVVIKGLMHNDDPAAATTWMPTGSFWTQPAGEEHITSANGEENLIYLEIDSGPYLVKPSKEAFDNGERPINIDQGNLVWLSINDSSWVNGGDAQISYLWGDTSGKNGTFVKLPAEFNGYIEGMSQLKAVLVKGMANYRWNKQGSEVKLSPSSFFSSSEQGKHYLNTQSEVVLYINSMGKYHVKQ